MKKQELYELIESYINNALSETQRHELEQRMASDASFRREVEFHRELQARFNTPGRLRLRTTLAGIVKRRAEARKHSKYYYAMKRWLQYYARALGERPALVLAFLLVMSVLLYYRLVYFVSIAPRGIFGMAIQEAILQMGGLVALICGILLWRLTVADRRLRKMVLDKYREAIRLVDSNAKSTVRDLAGRLGIRRNLYSKLLRLITLTPGPFVALVLILALINILLWLALRYLPQGPAGSVWEDIFVNYPWAFVTFVSFYTIYNDIRIMADLRHVVESIPVVQFADFFEHLEKFKKQLSREELNILNTLILYQHLSDKEIARLIKGNDTDFIKTLRVAILKRWGKYSTDNHIEVPLEKLLTVFYFERPYNRIYSGTENPALN